MSCPLLTTHAALEKRELSGDVFLHKLDVLQKCPDTALQDHGGDGHQLSDLAGACGSRNQRRQPPRENGSGSKSRYNGRGIRFRWSCQLSPGLSDGRIPLLLGSSGSFPQEFAETGPRERVRQPATTGSSKRGVTEIQDICYSETANARHRDHLEACCQHTDGRPGSSC